MGHINKKRLGGAVVSLLLLLLLVGVTQEVIADPEPPGGVPKECASQVHFFSADVQNNFFGPASDGDVARQAEELHARRCLDPALVVAHAHAWRMVDFAELNGDEQFAGKIRELIDNRDAWRMVVFALETLEKQSVASIETMSGSYQTLYMLDGVIDVPLIRQAAPDRPEFKVIRFVHPDGRIVNLKLDCGFQPVAQSFPGIPPVKAPKPKPTPATRPGPKSTTTTPPRRGTTTTTTTPKIGRKGVVPTTVPPPPVTSPRGTPTTEKPWTPPTAPPDTAPGGVTPTTVNSVPKDRPGSGWGATNTTSPPTTTSPPADGVLPPGGGKNESP